MRTRIFIYDMIWYDMIWYDMMWHDVIWSYDIHCYIHYHQCHPDYHYCYHCDHYSILKSLSANMFLYRIYQLYTCSLFATTGHVSNAGGLCFFNRKIGPPSLRKCYHQGPHFVRNMYPSLKLTTQLSPENWWQRETSQSFLFGFKPTF